MDYRVIQEFKLSGDPPDQAGTDRLRDRLRAAAPESDAVVELGLGRMRVVMRFDAADADAAVDRAKATAATVFGSPAAHVDVEPAEDPGLTDPQERCVTRRRPTPGGVAGRPR